MDRHVIKGRGKNRGKYLCYARMAGLPPSDGYVWLPEQRKAARHDHPKHRSGGWGYVENLATEYNGYFVTLVAPKSIIARVGELKSFIAKHAAGATERPNCYWLDGDWSGDEGPDYCWDCARKEVDKAYAKDPEQFVKLYGDYDGKRDNPEDYYNDAIRGGYSMDHDSTPHCEGDSRGIQLDGTLTDYGADEEISVLTTDCAPSFDDADGWYALDMAVMNLQNDDPRWKEIARVVDAAMEAERQYVANQDALTASEGMTEVRGVFLDLLAVRKEQKAPDPSYRLWNEFRAWVAIPYEKRSGTKDKELQALERRLFQAAKKFAHDLGYTMSGDCIKAPYGTYYWRFVVEVEQYQLWEPIAFLEGREHWLRPRNEGDKGDRNRDDNPYQTESEEHRQWDCGFISSEHPLP